MTRASHPPRRLVLLLVSVAAGTLVAGCGGGSGTSGTSRAAIETARPVQVGTAAGSSQARAAFAAAAQAICTRRHRRLGAPKKATLARLHEITVKRSGVERHTIAEMDALRPPPPLVEEWSRIIGYSRTLAAATQRIGEDARAKNIKDLEATAAASEAALRQLSGLATAIGVPACSRI